MSEHVQSLLSAHLHGELSPQEQRVVDVHLRECEVCLAELQDLRRTDGMLAALPGWVPPDSVWRRIEVQIDEAPPERAPRRGRWAAAAAAVAAAVLLFLLFPSGNGSIALDPYLSRVEGLPRDSSSLAELAGGFRAVPAAEGLRAAGMSEAKRRTPSPEFALWQARAQRFDDGEVAQLVYRGQGGAFSVVIAPHSADLDFGQRKTERVRMGDWECTQIESERLAVFWSVSRDRQTVLIAAAEQDLDVVSILRFFVYGQWDRES